MNPLRKKRYITVDQLESFALGAAVLGSGGGGDPSYFKSIARYQIEKYGPVELLSPYDVTKEDLIIPLAGVGAPLVLLEKLMGMGEIEAIFKNIERLFHKKPTIIMPAEIGGANGIIGVIAASMLGLPLLDADLIGRAFPQLQMTLTHLNHIPMAPMIIADSVGTTVIIESQNHFMIESIARNSIVAMGSSVIASIYPMSGEQIEKNVIHNSISYAMSLGEVILNARQENKNPIQSLITSMNGHLIGTGTIIDVNQSIKNGFLLGTVTLVDGDIKYRVEYQNENLAVFVNDTIKATTPNILILCEEQTGMPLMPELLVYGVKVSILAFKGPDFWTTPEELQLVGPRVFGYDFDYIPLPF